MASSNGAGVGARRVKSRWMSGASRACLLIPATIGIALALAGSPASAQTAANPIELLFVDNSFVHGKLHYDVSIVAVSSATLTGWLSNAVAKRVTSR